MSFSDHWLSGVHIHFYPVFFSHFGLFFGTSRLQVRLAQGGGAKLFKERVKLFLFKNQGTECTAAN